MSTHDDRFSGKGGRASGHDAGPTSKPPQVGKVSLIQLRFGPNAPQPTEPNKRTITEQLVPIQPRGDAPDDAAGVEPPPAGGGGAPLPPEVRARMEAALGGKFAGVRVHISAYADTIGARARSPAAPTCSSRRAPTIRRARRACSSSATSSRTSSSRRKAAWR